MNTVFILFFILLTPGKLASTIDFSTDVASSILKTFYQWLTPKEQLVALQQKQASWASSLSGWEEADQKHCAVFVDFAKKQKQFSMETVSLKFAGQTEREFIVNALEKIRTKINEEIKTKFLKKDQASLVLFQEMFSIGKQMVGKLVDAHAEWEKNKEKVNNNNNNLEQKQQQRRRELAVHKYMQLELFFTKCALRMDESQYGKSQPVLFLSYPNDNELFSEPYFDEKISVVHWEQQEDDTVENTTTNVLTRDVLSLDQAGAMVALLKTFIGNLCSKSFTDGKGKKDPKKQQREDVYECANENGVQFAKLFGLFTAEIKKPLNVVDLDNEAEQLEEQNTTNGKAHVAANVAIELSPLAQELLLYELHRIRQRLEDIGKQVELTEQRKVRALLAAVAKYGEQMVRDLLAAASGNQLIVVEAAKDSTAKHFLLDKYHYTDMAEWFEAVHRKMKRHIKYHVNSIVYAPNGIRAQPLRTPKIDGKSSTIDEGSKFLKKRALTDDIRWITTLIGFGQISMRKGEDSSENSVGNGGEEQNQEQLCAEMDKMKSYEKNLKITAIPAVKRLIKSNELLREIGLQCIVKLTGIHGAAIETTMLTDGKFKSVWHQKAAEELEQIAGRFWGLHWAESHVAKALGAHECTAGWNGRKAADLHQKVGKIAKVYIDKAKRNKKNEETGKQQENENVKLLSLEDGKELNSGNNSAPAECGGTACKPSMNLLENVQKTLANLKENMEAAKNENVFLFNGKTKSPLFDKLSEKFEKLGKLHASLQRVLLAHTEYPRKIQPSDAELIRGAVHLQDAKLKLLRQYALEEIRKAEFDVQLGAIEKGNVIEFGTNNDNVIVQLEHFKFASYDQEGKPRSSGQQQNRSILIPGELQLVSGNLRIKEQIEHSFMATAKFSLEICFLIPFSPCINVCNNGEQGKRLGKTVEGFLVNLAEKILSLSAANKKKKKAAEVDGGKKEMKIKDILKMVSEFPCTLNFLFQKEIFDLPAVTFTERFIHDIFTKHFGIHTTTTTKTFVNNLDATVKTAGLMEPEEGFFELPSLLSKDIIKWMPEVKFKLGIDVFEAATEEKKKEEQEKEEEKKPKNGEKKKPKNGEKKDEEKDEKEGDGGKAPSLLFAGKPIVSLKLPATNGYVEVKLV